MRAAAGDFGACSLPATSGAFVYLRKLLLLAAALIVALVVLGACGDDDDGGVATESAVTPPQSVRASASPSSTTGSEHNDADVQFAQEMIVHHQGALAMAKLGEQQADTTEVRALARRIRTAQEAEVETLRSWLKEWDEPVPSAMRSTATATSTSAPMDHAMAASPKESESPSATGESGSGVSGMGMSEMALGELDSADGVEFDRMFLTMMIEHHREATAMAKTEQAQGLYAEAIELAKEIESAQQAEITEMEELLAEL
jgi:uncharacterized protein (DUF305 family)